MWVKFDGGYINLDNILWIRTYELTEQLCNNYLIEMKVVNDKNDRNVDKVYLDKDERDQEYERIIAEITKGK